MKPVAAPRLAVRPPLLLVLAVLLLHLAWLRGNAPELDLRAPPATVRVMTRQLAPAAVALPAPVTRVNRPAPAPSPVLPQAAQAQPNAAAGETPATTDAHPIQAPDPSSRPGQAKASAPALPTSAPASTSMASDPTPTPAETSNAVPGATERALQVAIAPSMKLRYQVAGESKRLPYSASGELLWQHDGTRYSASLEIGAFLIGSRRQTSQGQITSQGLQPDRFGDKSRSEQAAHFERDKGKVVFSANTPDAPLLPGAQDRLSLLLQLGAMLAGEPQRYPPGTTISVQTVGAREADLWQFTVEDPETLSLPGGSMSAIKLARQPRRLYDVKVELWLAPHLNHLPVRVKLTQANGDFVDQTLRSMETP